MGRTDKTSRTSASSLERFKGFLRALLSVSKQELTEALEVEKEANQKADGEPDAD